MSFHCNITKNIFSSASLSIHSLDHEKKNADSNNGISTRKKIEEREFEEREFEVGISFILAGFSQC